MKIHNLEKMLKALSPKIILFLSLFITLCECTIKKNTLFNIAYPRIVQTNFDNNEFYLIWSEKDETGKYFLKYKKINSYNDFNKEESQTITKINNFKPETIKVSNSLYLNDSKNSKDSNDSDSKATNNSKESKESNESKDQGNYFIAAINSSINGSNIKIDAVIFKDTKENNINFVSITNSNSNIILLDVEYINQDSCLFLYRQKSTNDIYLKQITGFIIKDSEIKVNTGNLKSFNIGRICSNGKSNDSLVIYTKLSDSIGQISIFGILYTINKDQTTSKTERIISDKLILDPINENYIDCMQIYDTSKFVIIFMNRVNGKNGIYAKILDPNDSFKILKGLFLFMKKIIR